MRDMIAQLNYLDGLATLQIGAPGVKGDTGDVTPAATAAAGTATTKAGEAASSATTASTKAAEAASSATNASGSADTASTAASLALTRSTSAGDSAIAAAGSATAANNSMVTAAAAVEAATTQAEAATIQANTATTKADTATTQADTSSSSAVSSQTSALNASTSMDAAAASASAAATSAITSHASQVSADWNATSGVAQILNKPVIGSVTTVNSLSPDGAGNIALTTTNTPEGTNLYFTAARVLAQVLTGLSTATNAAITASDTVLTAAGKLQKQITDLLALKDATGGYAGLTLFKINFKNAANTFTSFFTNTNTAARTYAFQDRDGTIADNADLALKAALTGATFTGANYYAGMQSIAASPTINLSAATSNYIGLTTGTGPITAFTVPAGAKFTLRFVSGGITVNHNGGSLILPGAQNIVAVSGEVWEVIADAANSVRVISTSNVATGTEIQNAVNNSKHVSPIGLLDAVAFTKYFQSNDYTISSAAALSITHNIARTPVLMQVFVKCITAEGNYVTGDILQINPGAGASGSGCGLALSVGSVNINVRLGSAASPILLNDNGTGAVFAATNSKWSLFVRAWG